MNSVATTVRAVERVTPNPTGLPEWRIDTDHGVQFTAPAAAYVIHAGLVGRELTLNLDRTGLVYAIAREGRRIDDEDTGEDHATDRARDLVYGL
ncbi:hypothetical protein [Nocardia asteroides]|uniref:hypothetical protein n=1 Tax=Nocardia asteroides TaxID=1824 RepID=UPI0033ECEF88